MQIWNSIPNLRKSIFYLILTNLNVEKIDFVPFNVPTADFHGQFTAIYVHKRERIGESLQYSCPIPRPSEKNAA